MARRSTPLYVGNGHYCYTTPCHVHETQANSLKQKINSLTPAQQLSLLNNKKGETDAHTLLIGSAYSIVRKTVLGDKGCPPRLLEKYADSKKWEDRFMVAKNTNTPHPVLKKLQQDPNPYVMQAATLNPKTQYYKQKSTTMNVEALPQYNVKTFLNEATTWDPDPYIPYDQLPDPDSVQVPVEKIGFKSQIFYTTNGEHDDIKTNMSKLLDADLNNDWENITPQLVNVKNKLIYSEQPDVRYAGVRHYIKNPDTLTPDTSQNTIIVNALQDKEGDLYINDGNHRVAAAKLMNRPLLMRIINI